MKGIHPSISSHRLNRVRRFHPDRQKIIRDEIDKLLEAGFIREMEYPDWLANVVVVPKKEGKWRVCVDYTNLNNACPKDNFPLPRIDHIVDSTARQGMLSFLDAFSRYHQIPMAPANEENTAFITPHGLYCYKVMPFRLKNVGATYQRLMTKIFKPLVGCIVEVYINDIVVKSKTRGEHALHLQEVFHLLRKYDMKLNPSKCAFSVSARKFLGFMVSQRGIEELQRLTGKLVALGRFIARFTDELRPFFLAIRKAGTTGWTESCQSAFEKIKHYLTQPPILSSPLPGEKLYMYLAVSEWAISAALFRCSMHKEQKPIYYVSRALADVETSTAQKLRTYFQAHLVVVLTDQPLRNILYKPDLTGRMLQWAIELSEYGIEYQPRLSMKGQVMADFVVEYSQKPAQHKEPREEEWWTLRVDEASRSSGSRVGLLLQSPTGEQLEQAIRLGFPASNNEVEYEAILSGLDLALALFVSKLWIYSDSQLVVRQAQEEYGAKDECMACYLTKVRHTLQRFSEWTIEKIPRTDNKHPLAILLRRAKETTRSGRKCLNRSEALYVLAELHEGVCGNHSGGRSLAHWAHSQGYYWPTMKKDAATYVKKCDKCQRHAPIPHVPSKTLKPISSPWPFAQWGMDIKKFLLVATDYFSKWVEAEAYASIKDKDVTKFMWKNIICCFGIPQTIIANNGLQFDSITFRNFCSELNIRNLYSTPCCPQSNGQAEATNITLVIALKKRLEQAKGKWRERIHSDGRYQQRAAAHYNRKARPKIFKIGTLILRKVFENTAERGAGKFLANWEDPYIVSKTSESGAYHLQKLDGTPLLRPWNVSNLRQYYQ
uniref:Uncharacterized protein n=1 Tax=Vitis vinifera TaxID=29760 RepID=A5B6V1_VITVI|nr:hypothetical protein VITISV_042320 [Vitis vinifera]